MIEPEAHFARCDQLNTAMAEAGLDALVVAGRGVIGQHGWLMYLAGYCPVIRPAFAILIAGRAPILLVTTPADVWLARRRSPLDDIRLLHPGPNDPTGSAAAIRDCLSERNLTTPKIGIVGLEEIIPAAEYFSWQQALPSAQLVGATAVMAAVKAIKTPTDIAGLRQTAVIVDNAMGDLLAALRDRRSLREATGAAEARLRAEGAVEILVYLSEQPHFLHRPTAAHPEPGMLLTVFVEASNEDGYWIELARMVAIGPLDPARARIVNLSLRAMDVAQATLRPGMTGDAAYRHIADTIASGGMQSGLWYGHGVGVDHDQPVIGRDVATTLEPNMVIALHPHIVDEAAGIGASVCDTFLINDTGATPFSRFPRDLITISGEH